MSRNVEKDSAGRKQPSKYLRKKRATNAAKHRWKQKMQLIPGVVRPWSERSFANKLQHLAAARKGGNTTGHQIREQQRLFWRWYHGDCKAQLDGPFKAVVETFERIEAAFVQQYGYKSPKHLAWDGFFADMFTSYVLAACWNRTPEDIERSMWARYQEFMEADDAALWNGLLSALLAHDDAQEEKRIRIEAWRQKNSGR